MSDKKDIQVWRLPTPDAGTKMRSDKVKVFYGEKQALADVDLDIKSNEVMALIGPSGCGKSTFSLPEPDERRYRYLPRRRQDYP